MPLRPFSRCQTWLFPPTLEELIPEDHPARFVGAFVDALEQATWVELGIGLEGEVLGSPAYHPRALLGVWLYGFMTGTRSSRKLEAACRDELPYLWLTGWQHPDHNTLWRFYREHRVAMRHLFKGTVHAAVKVGLVDLAVQAVDGTKMAGNAATDRTYDKEGLQKLLERTEKAIRELEDQNETGNDPPPVHLPKKLTQAQRLLAEVKAAMAEMAEEGKKRINLTDGDSGLMKGRHGVVAGYNLQAVVSPTTGDTGAKEAGLLITAAEVVQDKNDVAQLVPMLNQAKETTGRQAEVYLADAGYYSGHNLAVCEQQQQVVVMPEGQEQVVRLPYHKDKFIYDAAGDCYLCPEGQTLRFASIRHTGGKARRLYRAHGATCRKCVAFGICTRDHRHGRELEVGPYDAVLRRHRDWMATEEAKMAYRRRKQISEPVFGIIREQMGVRRFLLRGLAEVRAEAKLLAIAFNLRTLYRIWQRWSHERRITLIEALARQESRHRLFCTG